MAISIGSLRHRVRIERSAEGAATSKGTRALTWSTVIPKRWASITSLVGSESLAGGDTVVAESSSRIDMRFVDGIRAKDRAVWEKPDNTEVIFDITYVSDPDNRRRWLSLFVREAVL